MPDLSCMNISCHSLCAVDSQECCCNALGWPTTPLACPVVSAGRAIEVLHCHNPGIG